jgi:prevent-host-death family protein
MEVIGVESARSRLGQLLEEVAASGEPVAFAKRGQELGVLVSRDEYARTKEALTRVARAELAERLAEIRRRVAEAGLDESVVDEAIEAVRRL